ncbi:MAG: hypothetical protein WDO13_10865 [Verrucomicrobiota bacterium]
MAIPEASRGILVAVLCVVRRIGEAHLADLSSLLHGDVVLRLLDTVGDRAKGDAGQDCDDGDNNQQFDEGKTASATRTSGTEVETVRDEHVGENTLSA